MIRACSQITTTTQTYNRTVTLNQSSKMIIIQIMFKENIKGPGKALSINSPNLISSIAASNDAEITLNELELLKPVEISSSNAAGLKLSVSSISRNGETLTFAGNTSQFTLKD